MDLKNLPVFPDYDENTTYTPEFLFSLLGKHFVASDGVTPIYVPDDECNRDCAKNGVFIEYISYDADIRDINLHGSVH